MTAATAASPAFPSVWRLIAPLMVAEIVASLELTMIFAAIRSLITEFGSASAAGWLITSFMLSSAAGAALFGRFGDLLGRRRVLLAVLAISTAGALTCSLTHNLGWLIAGRAMQGAAGSVIPLCFGILREHADPARVPFGISLLSATSTFASTTGLVLGGLIIDFSDWTMIFKLITVLGVLAFLCILLFVGRDRQWNPEVVREDLLGGLLFVPATVSLLLAIESASHAGLQDRLTLFYGGLAMASLAAWIWRELTARNPLIEVRLLATRGIGIANAIYVALALGAFQGGQIMALLGQQQPATGAGLGLSAAKAGFLMVPASFLTAACYPLIARLNEAFGPRLVTMAGFLMIIAGFGSLGAWHHNVAFVMAFLIIQSVGLGLVFVTIPTVIVSASPPDRVSEATGMMTVIRATAMAVGAQVVATLLSARHGQGGSLAHFPSEHDYLTVFLFVCATGIVGVLLACVLPARLASRDN